MDCDPILHPKTWRELRTLLETTPDEYLDQNISIKVVTETDPAGEYFSSSTPNVVLRETAVDSINDQGQLYFEVDTDR